MGSNAKRKIDGKGVPREERPEPAGPMGDALRSVYEKAVEEQIPQEMLDLLGKLK